MHLPAYPVRKLSIEVGLCKLVPIPFGHATYSLISDRSCSSRPVLLGSVGDRLRSSREFAIAACGGAASLRLILANYHRGWKITISLPGSGLRYFYCRMEHGSWDESRVW